MSRHLVALSIAITCLVSVTALLYFVSSEDDAGFEGYEAHDRVDSAATGARRSEGAPPAEPERGDDNAATETRPELQTQEEAAPLARVSGRVVDEFGAAVPAAAIRLRYRRLAGRSPEGAPPVERELSTDSEGRFAFEGVAHPYELRLRIRPQEHIDLYHAVVLRDASEVDIGEIVTQRGGSIEGRVTDGSIGLEGATVLVDVTPESPSRGDGVIVFGSSGLTQLSDAVRSGTTDVNGFYTITGLGTGAVMVEARAKGRPRVQRDGLALTAGERRTDVNLTLASGRRVSGIVRDDTGAALGGVAVKARARDGIFASIGAAHPFAPQKAGTITDDEGRFTLEGLPHRELRLALSKAAWRTSTKTVSESESDIEVELLRSSIIGGRVTDSKGAPLENVAVRIAPPARVLLGAEAAAIAELSRPEGAYAIVDLPGGDARFTVMAEGRAPSKIAVDSLEAGKIRVEHVTLTRSRFVGGQVIDPRGAPAKGAKVTRRRKRADGRLVEAHSVSAGPDGVFAFDDVADGDHVLTASSRNWLESEPLKIAIEGADQTGLHLELRAGGSVLGRVVDGIGDPVAGAVVSLKHDPKADVAKSAPGSLQPRERETKTSNDGRFEFLSVIPASYRAEARKADLRPSRPQMIFMIANEAQKSVTGMPVLVHADETAEIELVLEERSSISGTAWVTGPIPKGSEVILRRISEDGKASTFRTATAKVAQDGRYEIEDLDPAPYRCELSLPGCPRAAVEDVTLHRGPTRLDFSLDTGSISGTVLDAEGRPIEAQVRVVTAGSPSFGGGGTIRIGGSSQSISYGDGGSGESIATGPDGRYHLPAVPVGQREFRATRGASVTMGSAEIRAGRESNLDIQLGQR